MRNTTRFVGIGVAAALAALALAGCGGGDGTAGPDAAGDLPDGIQADVPPDGQDDAPRPDVPAEGVGEGTDDGPADAPDAADAPEVDAGPCDPGEALAKGKDWLQKAEPGFARTELEAALAACPDDVEARFLAGLAEIVYGSEQFVSLLTILEGQGTGPKLPPFTEGGLALPASGDASQNEILAAKLHLAFVELREHFERGLGHLERLEDRDLTVVVDAVPVYLGITPTMIFRGHFDAGDVLLMRAVASLVTGILDVLVGQDLDTDLMSVISGVKSMFGDTIDWPVISRLAAYLLVEDPRFLTLHPEDGQRFFEDARVRFAAVGPLLDAALLKMDELGTDADDVSFVEHLAGSTVLNVRSRIRLDDDRNVIEEPWYLILSEPTLQAFRDCSHSILTPGAKVTLHGGVIPVLSTVVAGFVRVGLLDLLGISLPGGIDLAALEVDDLQGLLRTLLPNVMAFDWGAFYQHPVGLRAWLPSATTDRPMLENVLRAEWECPEDTAADGYPTGSLRLLCAETAALADGPHFVDTSWATEADGIASGFPVLAFDDPTLNGMAYVDLDGMDKGTDATTYQAATGTTLNAALAKLLVGVLSLLQ